MSEHERSVGAESRGRPDTWRDFRRSMAMFVMVLFWLMLIAAGISIYQYATTDVSPDAVGAFRFLSVAAALGVASYAGIRVLRANDTVQSKRFGRIMWIAVAVAVVTLVVTGVVGDRIR